MSQLLLSSPELTRSQFHSISDMVRGLCGINLHIGKVALVRARLNKRLRQLGLRSFDQYMDLIRDDVDGSETVAMLNALSTNLTHFFREPKHFEALRKDVIPDMLDRHEQDRRLRLWSAGCSSGEEPYSIAMTLKDAAGDLAGWDVGILATDLSTRMLQVAREGVYPSQRMRDVPPGMLMENFCVYPDRSRPCYRVRDSLRKMVHFARLNLMAPWPMKGKFDAIFCRNVMIYFDKPTQETLVRRFWDQLAPGGTLFIGHSESLTGVRHGFRYLRPTVYQKT